MTECIEFEIEKKELLKEHKRQEYLDKIIKEFAHEIDNKGGFSKKSKTGKRSIIRGTAVGIRALMERWFLIQEEYGANKEDVLVPSDPQEDKWLRRELTEGGFEDDTASELDKKLVEITKQLYSEFKEDISKIEDEKIKIQFEKDTFNYSINEKKEEVKIHDKNLKDLLTKYQKNQPDTNQYDPLFLQHVLILLIRYNTISGEVRGYQMALPEQVFSYLKENYHLQHECFASPLNACSCIGSYCSRFLDTDKVFGSEGSFFHYSVEEGCYESNPPFVEECMIRNIRHINEMLEKAEENKKALTFFIIVPKWDDEDCNSYNLTIYGKEDRVNDDDEKSPFFVKKIVVNKNNHFYRNGVGYKDDYAVMNAQNDSLLLVLQTTEARKNNPLDDDFEQRIMERWNKSSKEFKDQVYERRNYFNKRDYENDNNQSSKRNHYSSYGNNQYNTSRNDYSNYEHSDFHSGRTNYSDNRPHNHSSSYSNILPTNIPSDLFSKDKRNRKR